MFLVADCYRFLSMVACTNAEPRNNESEWTGTGIKKSTDDVALCVVFLIACFFHAKNQNRARTNERHDTDLCSATSSIWYDSAPVSRVP